MLLQQSQLWSLRATRKSNSFALTTYNKQPWWRCNDVILYLNSGIFDRGLRNAFSLFRYTFRIRRLSPLCKADWMFGLYRTSLFYIYTQLQKLSDTDRVLVGWQRCSFGKPRFPVTACIREITCRPHLHTIAFFFRSQLPRNIICRSFADCCEEMGTF